MNFFNGAELTANFVQTGRKKAGYPAWKMLALGFLAGVLLAVAATMAATASHDMPGAGAKRLVAGLLFPFGLCAILALGAELFTGGTLISISVLAGKTRLRAMLKSWALVYMGNFAGSAAVAWGNLHFGQLAYGEGSLALYTIKTAAAKCSLGFWQALGLGVLCNVLVCAGVLMSSGGKDMAGRMMGAYIPVAIFIVCGYEHSVANMYYVPAGLFAAGVPEYAALAANAGVNLSALTWPGFLLHNLLPVTLGNIVGGVALGCVLWYTQGKAKAEKGAVISVMQNNTPQASHSS